MPSREQIEEEGLESIPVELVPSIPTHMALYAETANLVTFDAINAPDAYSVELENVQGGRVESTQHDHTLLLSPSTDTMTFDAVVFSAEGTDRFEGLSYASKPVPGSYIELYNTRWGREIDKVSVTLERESQTNL